LIESPRTEVQRIVDEYCRANPSGIRVLDAGCGCGSRIRFPEKVKIVGIDIDADQLANNERIHEKILGDIQTYTTDQRFDITFCWDLLEHLEHPEEAVARLLTWTRPGGLIVISGPNPLSLKGLITKCTPHAFHQWVYRHVYQYQHKPFRTYMKSCISPGHILAFFEGHRIEYAGFEDHRFTRPFLNTMYGAAKAVLRVLSLGKYDPSQSQLFLVVRKKT